jgi:hypothetical protein
LGDDEEGIGRRWRKNWEMMGREFDLPGWSFIIQIREKAATRRLLMPSAAWKAGNKL